jgi:hypothetical protein
MADDPPSLATRPMEFTFSRKRRQQRDAGLLPVYVEKMAAAR